MVLMTLAISAHPSIPRRIESMLKAEAFKESSYGKIDEIVEAFRFGVEAGDRWDDVRPKL